MKSNSNFYQVNMLQLRRHSHILKKLDLIFFIVSFWKKHRERELELTKWKKWRSRVWCSSYSSAHRFFIYSTVFSSLICRSFSGYISY